MADGMRVVGLSGSLAEVSTSRMAVQVALDGAREEGAEVELWDVREMALPMFDPDSDAVPEAARGFADAVHAARGMVWCSPLYHGTVSGAFKNALDWLELLGRRDPPYLADKVVGLVAVAGGVQGLQAVNTMEFVVRALRGWSVPMVIPIARAGQAFERDGGMRDEKVERQLRSLGAEVVRAARQFGARGHCDYAQDESASEELNAPSGF